MDKLSEFSEYPKGIIGDFESCDEDSDFWSSTKICCKNL